MARFCYELADRMANLNIISEDDKDCYCYSIQLLVERVICFSLILISAVYFHSIIEVSAFIIVFTLIRKNSDGIHCRSSLGCFCLSTLVSISTIGVSQLLSSSCAIRLGGGGFGYDSVVHNSQCKQSGFGFIKGGIGLS